MRTLSGLVILLFSAWTAAGETVALVGATLHPVSGPDLEGAVLLLSGDTIAAIGTDVAVPPEARRHDVTGKHIYPAFVHASSVLGLSEIGSVAGSVDTTENGDLHPELRAEVAFHADSRILPATRAGGVLYALVAPQGGLVAGTSAVMSLEGWTWEDMTLRTPVALHIRFPAYRARRRSFFGRPPKPQEDVDKERKAAVTKLVELFAAGRAHARALTAAAEGQAPAPPTNLKLAALQPVLDGSLPVFLHATEKLQIEGALDFARDQQLLHPVLVTSADAAELIPRLAEQGASVILHGVLRLPSRSWQPYDTPFTAAARLHEGGIPFAITDGQGLGPSNSRNLPFHAAMAAAYGLPREAALRAITLDAATILGVEDRIGSLEVGKAASFLVTDGDPLEITTRLEEVWFEGRPLDLAEDPQRRLYERYQKRPSPTKAAP